MLSDAARFLRSAGFRDKLTELRCLMFCLSIGGVFLCMKEQCHLSIFELSIKLLWSTVSPQHSSSMFCLSPQCPITLWFDVDAEGISIPRTIWSAFNPGIYTQLFSASAELWMYQQFWVLTYLFFFTTEYAPNTSLTVRHQST